MRRATPQVAALQGVRDSPEPRTPSPTEGTDRVSEPQTETPDEPEVETPDAAPAPVEPDEPDEPEQDEPEQDERETDEPEQDEQPEGPVGAVGEKELEKMFKRVDTANARYSRSLGEIMGEEATVLEPCPRCSDPFLGFIFPPMMKPVTADQKDAILKSVGEQPAMATNAASFARRCDECDGNGVVLSGSRRNEFKAIGCQKCERRGFIYVGPPPANAESIELPLVEDTATNGTPEPAPDTDLWGRPVGHPDYGVHPMYATAR